MDDNLGASSFEEEKSRSPLMTLAILGIALAGCCIVFIGASFLFQPDQLSLVDKYFPSPTTTPTRTPTLTPTPNLTATQQIIQSTATAQAIQILATNAVSQWPILFSDAFDSNKNNWPAGSLDDEYANGIREIKDGKYSWDVTAKEGFFDWIYPNPNNKLVSNFYLSAEIKRESGSSQSDCGLVFRKHYNGNFYYFGIDDEGFFVYLNYNDEWLDMIKYTQSSAILPEKPNRLTVIAEGSHFIFFINDQFVGEMTDDHIDKGKAALAVQLYEADAKAIFEFDNFELRAP